MKSYRTAADLPDNLILIIEKDQDGWIRKIKVAEDVLIGSIPCAAGSEVTFHGQLPKLSSSILSDRQGNVAAVERATLAASILVKFAESGMKVQCALGTEAIFVSEWAILPRVISCVPVNDVKIGQFRFLGGRRVTCNASGELADAVDFGEFILPPETWIEASPSDFGLFRWDIAARLKQDLSIRGRRYPRGDELHFEYRKLPFCKSKVIGDIVLSPNTTDPRKNPR